MLWLRDLKRIDALACTEWYSPAQFALEVFRFSYPRCCRYVHGFVPIRPAGCLSSLPISNLLSFRLPHSPTGFHSMLRLLFLRLGTLQELPIKPICQQSFPFLFPLLPRSTTRPSENPMIIPLHLFVAFTLTYWIKASSSLLPALIGGVVVSFFPPPLIAAQAPPKVVVRVAIASCDAVELSAEFKAYWDVVEIRGRGMEDRGADAR
jgi:hypothetical protein